MSRISLFLLVFCTFSFGACMPVTNCPQLPPHLNSGKNDTNGSLMAVWTNDDTWEGFSSLWNGGAPVQATVASASVNDTLFGTSPALPDSMWIKPIINANIATWEYTTEFCLNTGYSNPQLQLSVISRDQAEILLNGVPVAGPGGDMLAPVSALVTDPAMFDDGWNTVSVRVSNARYLNAIASIAGSITADVPFSEPDLAIQKKLLDSLKTGQQANYGIFVKNQGVDTALPPITVTDVLPTGLTYHSFVAPAGTWSCSASSQTVTCSLPTALVSGAQAPQLTIVVNVGLPGDFPPGTEFVENCATVTHSLDVDSSNDSSCVEARVN